MGSALVVVDEPRIDELLRLARRVKQIRVRDLLAKRAIEALDEGVLYGLSGLDVLQPDAPLRRPLGEGLRGQAGCQRSDCATAAPRPSDA